MKVEHTCEKCGHVFEYDSTDRTKHINTTTHRVRYIVYCPLTQCRHANVTDERDMVDDELTRP